MSHWKLKDQSFGSEESQQEAEAVAYAQRQLAVVAHLTNNQWNNFYSSLLHKFKRYGKLTMNQIVAVENSIKKDLEREQKRAQLQREEDARFPNREEVPSARIKVTGEVQSLKLKDTPFGMTFKMLVLDDRGFKVYGTVPSANADLFSETWELSQRAGKGMRVTFTATTKPSEDDKHFGFYSRPSGAELTNGLNV